MHYYQILPASRQYYGDEPLTYHYDKKIKAGKIVSIKVRGKSSLGIVINEVKKPDFKTQAIDEIQEFDLSSESLLLIKWMIDYYPAPLGIYGQLFLPPSLRNYKKIQETTKPHADLPPLSADQQNALEEIGKAKDKTVVLHGETGTGKTRVYTELAKKALAKGKSALILTPEIALTPQLVNNFKSSVKSEVYVTHSGLTPAQRRDLWAETAKSQKPVVVIGPRSALFMPVSNLGLVVVDEFHETAYKQEQQPYYHGVRIASKLASIHYALLVLGSATPSINDYFIAEHKKALVIRMKQKPLKNKQQSSLETKIVDLSKGDENSGYPLLSNTLVQAIEATLARKEQVMLFLNKRGSARAIVCQACGWRAACERCALPFTYHGDKHYLRCHTCGNKQPAPNSCPVCGSSDIVFKSPGTKAIAEFTAKLFPEARIARFDKDNLKNERFDQRHKELLSGDIDILIGTQLLAKGHDLPKLSTVGILLAENELQFPDYSSEERSYQLIKQLTGRVDRGHLAGHVVIQTYDPKNPTILSAIRPDSWNNFYKSQLESRKNHGFPPFYHVLKIEVSRASQISVQKAARQIYEHLINLKLPLEILGPHPSFIEKQNNRYVWQLIVKAKQRSYLIQAVKDLPLKSTYNLDPTHLL